MLDLHCHILPGADDGPRTLQESLEVARLPSQDGVTDVIVTPHCHRFLRNYREYVRDKVAQLNHVLEAEAIAIRVWPGSEIRVSDTQAFRQNYEKQLYCHLGDDPRFTLLEFPWQTAAYPPDAPLHTPAVPEACATQGLACALCVCSPRENSPAPSQSSDPTSWNPR